jgi:hypothetical protein
MFSADITIGDQVTGGNIMALKRTKALLIALAVAATPLVTTAACDPRTGTFDFFRDDDDRGLFDVFYYDDYYSDPYYYDDYYYDDYYYEDCFFCW